LFHLTVITTTVTASWKLNILTIQLYSMSK